MLSSDFFRQKFIIISLICLYTIITVKCFPKTSIEIKDINSNDIDILQNEIKLEFDSTISDFEKNKHEDATLNDNFQKFWTLETQDEIRGLQSRIMSRYMDKSVDPCEDFYQYACGNWNKYHPIPEDVSQHSIFSILKNNMIKSLKVLLSDKKNVDATKNVDPTDIEEHVKVLYSTCSDIKTMNERGAQPLLNVIDAFGGWPVLDENWSEEKFDLVELLAKLSQYGFGSFLHTNVDIDLKDTDKHTIYVLDPTLGLKNSDDYLEEKNSDHMKAYKNLIISVLTLLEIELEKAEEFANKVVELETKIANLTNAELLHDIEMHSLYDAKTISILYEKYPQFNWTKYFNIVYDKKFNVDQQIVIFGSPEFNQVFDLLMKIDNTTISNYLIWRVVHQMLEYLDERFIAALQTFNESLTGQKKAEARWKLCIQETNDGFGMAVSSLFVKAHFRESSKEDVSKLTKEIKDVFRRTLLKLDWLDEETKYLAEVKVNHTGLAVGYPEFILNKKDLNEYYDGVHMERGKYFENILNLKRFTVKKDNRKLEKESIKTDWPLHATVINAFFEQYKNRIVMPAGILQPPIYHNMFPKALNYGAIGVFIGHELTHGFDTVGREFDEEGNLKVWWTNSSIEIFNNKTECFIDQYSNFSMHNKSLVGESSKEENIADNGGIRQSFAVYKNWLENASEEEKENDKLLDFELSNERLFFLSFAQSWCEFIRPEAIENRIQTDVHCPGKFRVLGTLSNFEEFGKAFQCPIGSLMNPETDQRCRLW